MSSQQPTRATNEDRDKLVARAHGISIHAATCVDGRDRKRLQRLCQYISRPALAQDRLQLLDDGRVCYDMKRTWADGTEAIVLEPFDFIARLCALVPPPYFNLTRFHGVFAPNAKLRAQVVPDNRAAASEPRQLELFTSDITTTLLHGQLHGQPANDASSGKPGRHPWAQLLRRTFAVDVLICPRCSAKMKLVEMATTPSAIQKALAKAGLADIPPPQPLPRVAGQLPLDFGQAS